MITTIYVKDIQRRSHFRKHKLEDYCGWKIIKKTQKGKSFSVVLLNNDFCDSIMLNSVYLNKKQWNSLEPNQTINCDDFKN